MQLPEVSVCIPTYNAAQYLADAIDSVLAQTFEDFELVVSDNASTDHTPELCQAYHDPRFLYSRSPENTGQSGNWNRCLSLARGTYVILLHADDLLMPEYLQRAVQVLDQHPEVGLVHCATQYIEPDGTPLYVRRIYEADRIDEGDVLFRRLVLEGCVVNPAGVLVRRSLYDEVGDFTMETLWGVDWHMWMRLALRTQVAYFAEPLAQYREHPQSGTSRVMATVQNGPDETWLFRDIFRRIPPARHDLHALKEAARRQSAHRTWCFAEEMCRLGWRSAARAQLRAAARIRPMIMAEGRFWALLAATVLGYGWFEQMHTWKQRLFGKPAAQAERSVGS
ncbi:glycosyltransferase family 2 protein [Candidatus Entotheonella palauensis]|uniref:glycosyltransferase family 2 protein n=1 Tax=Candidatus Entotheonella palauensis TaxID=93172 RepID=UPI0015C4E256|nr:glycosyltransferase [Candidatus Entotheonella palauensis]